MAGCLFMTSWCHIPACFPASLQSQKYECMSYEYSVYYLLLHCSIGLNYQIFFYCLGHTETWWNDPSEGSWSLLGFAASSFDHGSSIWSWLHSSLCHWQSKYLFTSLFIINITLQLFSMLAWVGRPSLALMFLLRYSLNDRMPFWISATLQRGIFAGF